MLLDENKQSPHPGHSSDQLPIRELSSYRWRRHYMSHVIEFWTERDYSHVVRDAGALSVTVTPPYAIGQLSAMNDWRQAFLSCQFKLPPLRLSASQGLGRLFERSCVRLRACYEA